MIIDSHAHACGVFLKGKDIIEILNKNNVDKIVLVPGELGSDKDYSLNDIASKFPNKDVVSITNITSKIVVKMLGTAKHIEEGNAYVHSLVKEYPERILQFYWVRLSLSNPLESLERHYAKYKFVGIKFHQCWESFKVGCNNFHDAAEWAASKNLPIFIHLFTKSQATKLAKYINEHPNTIFIVGHLFGLERYMKANIKADNTFFEISSPSLISVQRLMKAIKHFGAQRILLGSDTPYGENNLQLNIERIRSLEITDEEKNLILGYNMNELLRLS